MRSSKKTNENERENTRRILLVLFIFSLLCGVFGVLCLDGLRRIYPLQVFFLLAYVYGVGIIGVYLWGVWMALRGKTSGVRMLISVYVCALFIFLLFILLERTGFFAVLRNKEWLAAYLRSAGAWMPLAYITLQFLQVVVLPVPGIVSTMAGVALFGAFSTMLYSMIGILAGSIAAFFIGRKFGGKAAAWIVGEKNLQKWQEKLKGKDNFFLTVMFLLPLFPDDVLCFVAGLSSMSAKFFLIMITITRFVSIACTCYAADWFPLSTRGGRLAWLTFLIVGVLLAWLFYKYFEKNSTRFPRKLSPEKMRAAHNTRKKKTKKKILRKT